MTKRFKASVDLPVSLEEAFLYHQRPGALDRLVPPWESVTVESSDGSLDVGSRVVLTNRLMGIPLRWHARHTEFDPPNLFADVQDRGPFALWNHHHRFESIDAQNSRLTDDVQYRLPLGPLGNLFGGGFVRGKIESMFAYRHRITADDLSLRRTYPLNPMTFAVSGSSGLVGSSLSAFLRLMGHRVMRIVRHANANEDEIAIWNDPDGTEKQKLNEVDVVVHLAGKSIATDRWSDAVKKEIRDSRVIKTTQLAEAMASADRKPAVLISASACGVYGDCGDEIVTESSKPVDDFLGDVVQQWESACDPARAAGIRVVHPRIGLVLSPQDGALKKSLLPAKFCGGKLGSGKQWWSWIALDDLVGAIYHCVAKDDIEGVLNFVGPQPVRNKEFASTLGSVLGRPALFPAPAFALRIAFGEMADKLLFASTRAVPERLESTGYAFRFRDLESQLRYCLGKDRIPTEADS